MPEKLSAYDLVFRSAALPPSALYVHRMDGREGQSELFEFRLHVSALLDAGLDFDKIDAVLADAAHIAFGPDEEHKIHGVVRHVKTVATVEGAPPEYELSLVPRLWYLTQTFGSWVYQELNVPEIIKDVLTNAGLVEGDDWEFKLAAKYPRREYCLQYQETDYDFISRLMEHEGIFFFFTHADGKDKLVMTDANAAFAELPGFEAISYDPRGGTGDLAEVVTAVSRDRAMGPKSVAVRDYNWKTPSKILSASLAFDPAGKGLQYEYGDHFKDAPGAKRYARIRAEELYAQREVYQFTSRVRGLRPGHRFGLMQHHQDQYLQDYVVVAMEHTVVQYARGSEEVPNAGYTNSFRAIPTATTFRPVRKTPKPKIAGFIHAKIDGPGGAVGADAGAPIDDEGRYKITLLMDNTKTDHASSSRWVRRAQPFSGDGYGMHFPLHVGTEVMLIHVDGDPDRPVIIGTLPNPENATPVGAADATLNRIRSRSGLIMGFHDKRG